jgi:spore maturation protein CgeB
MTSPRHPLDIVFLGLSLSSSWGNGHATTYRALIRGLTSKGHRVLFLERDVEWYALNQDLAEPDFCEFSKYSDLTELFERFEKRLRAADAVIVGSYVPDGSAIIERLADLDLNRLCFYDIDTPVTLAMLNRGEETYLAKRQIPRFEAYFSFSGGEVLTRLKSEFGAKRAFPLYCSVDETLYRPTREPPLWDLGYLGTYSPDRQPGLEKLLIEPARRLPNLRFVVAGPQYPDDIDWPANVERIEHLAPAEHAAFYSRQRFTLNVTRADMIAAGWSPSVRIFEAAACGTPIISDEWRGLRDLLRDGQAILIAGSSEEVVSALLETDEASRGRIAKAARDVVLDRHTGKARADELAAALRSIPVRQAIAQYSRQYSA